MASLIFVGLQLKQSEEATVIELSESNSSRGIEMSTLISNHADVWQRACLGEELTPPEQVIAGNIFFQYLRGNFNSWTRMETTSMDGLGASFLTDSFAANIHRYPGFKQMAVSWDKWEQAGTRFDNSDLQRYKDNILARISELEIEEPNPNSEVMWCGAR